MLRIAALFGLIAAPAFSDVAEISNCSFEHGEMSSYVMCDALNISGTAIAGLQYGVIISQSDRTVPWFKTRDDRPLGQNVDGGIEPGETRNLLFWFGDIPKDAQKDALAASVQVVKATDVNGEPITPAD